MILPADPEVAAGGGAIAQELARFTDQDLIDLAHFLAHQGSKP